MHTLEGWSLRPAQSALRMTFVSTLIPMGELRIPATLAPLSSQRGVCTPGFRPGAGRTRLVGLVFGRGRPSLHFGQTWLQGRSELGFMADFWLSPRCGLVQARFSINVNYRGYSYPRP